MEVLNVTTTLLFVLDIILLINLAPVGGQLPNWEDYDALVLPRKNFSDVYEPYGPFERQTTLRKTQQPTYTIVAPRLVRPDSLYRISAVLLPSATPTLLKATLTHDKSHVASSSLLMDPGFTDSFHLTIPPTSSDGDYRLKIEGYDPLQGGLFFVEEARLQFTSQFLTVLVQTNRIIYAGDMEVKIRVILLRMDLKPFDDPVTVYILDPHGFVMRRWPSRPTNNGVVSLRYQLPEWPRKGNWTVMVEARTQTHRHQFFVERYFPPQFEVIVTTPAYLLDTDEHVPVDVVTGFHAEKVTLGNVTVRVLAKRTGSTGKFRLVKEDSPEWTPYFHYDQPLSEIEKEVGHLPDSTVRIEVLLFDKFLGETQMGFSETRIIKAQVVLDFTGPSTKIFKPGMPFVTQVYVKYDDDQILSPERLATGMLSLQSIATLGNGKTLALPEIVIPRKGEYQFAGANELEESLENWVLRQTEDARYERFRSTGVHEFQLHVPKGAEELRIVARYKDEEGEVESKLHALAYYSAREQYLGLITSTKKAKVGEFAVFHVKTSFATDFVSYVVTAKGLVVTSGQVWREVPNGGSTTTFTVPVSSDMTPSFKVVAFVTINFGEIVADAVTVPVESISRYKMNVTLEQGRDHTKETIQVVTQSEPGSFIGLSVLRSLQYSFQASNELSPSSVVESLYRLEPFKRSVHGVAWRDREGMRPMQTEYFPGPNYGPDAFRTFDLAGLVVFTDGSLPTNPNTAICTKTPGFRPCLIIGCYQANERCDGVKQCSDGSDEDDCPKVEDDREHFRIFRRNLFSDSFDSSDGDWTWLDIPVTDSGEELNDQPVPQTNEVWYINGFSMHSELGFTMLSEVVEYDGTPPFYLAIETPSQIRRGETLGVRLVFVNNLEEENQVLIVVEDSPDFLFVLTDAEGEVSHYKPKMVRGDHHHMIVIPPLGMYEVPIAIAPQIEQGTLEIKIVAMSQISRREHVHEVEILPEGVALYRHTSLQLDLESRAFVLKFLDIPVDESPRIAYENYRRYVYGSPKASVSVCGDIFGPVFPSMPPNGQALLQRSLKSFEAHIFTFGATLWSLHYLRLTNQLQRETMYAGFDTLNVELASLMRLYDGQGSFRLFTNSKPSVWVTAWVVRTLAKAQFQDWENYFFVDRQLLEACSQWLIGFQNLDGSFGETENYSQPLERKTVTNTTRNAAHTAHVLIALTDVLESLQGELKSRAATAKLKAVHFLERLISSIRDPYELALVSYSLTQANSGAKEGAFGKLHSMRRETEGMVYWSREPVPLNGIKYENQKPFLQARGPDEQDAVAVEASSYALLVYLMRDGINEIQTRTVTWLNTMRMTEGGFVSTFDTLIAMQALTEYAYRARLRDITDMTLTIDPSASKDVTEVIDINSENLASVHKIELPNVWGHVNVIGRGAGQAVLQLKIQYGIDYEPLKDVPKQPYFYLKVNEHYSTFRNKSHITIDACFRWLAKQESKASGSTALEVQLPTGYGIVQSDANHVVADPKYPFLTDVLSEELKVTWYMDSVSTNLTCFSYLIKRWYPVANQTMYRSALIYESYMPEHFELQIIEATPLYVLDICEVCGSYQCPYCPQYSVGLKKPMTLSVLFICTLIAMTWHKMFAVFSVDIHST